MRRQLDERRPEALSERKQACNEIICRALAVVEAAKMRDDLREFGTKPEPLGRCIRPLRHFRFAVNAVVGCVELNGPKVPAIGLWEQSTRRFLRISGTHPSEYVPRRTPCIYAALAWWGIQVPMAFRKGKVGWDESIE